MGRGSGRGTWDSSAAGPSGVALLLGGGATAGPGPPGAGASGGRSYAGEGRAGDRLAQLDRAGRPPGGEPAGSRKALSAANFRWAPDARSSRSSRSVTLRGVLG